MYSRALQAPIRKVPDMSTSRKSGFTLVELVLVIAIIAMISVLAIGKYAGVRDASKAKLNLANFSRIGASVDTFVALNDGALDRLDSLLYYGTSTDGSNAANMSSSISARLTSDLTNGVVLNPALCTDTSGYGISSGGLLCPYYLSAADVAALRNHLGLKYAMYGTDGTHFLEGDDGAWAEGSVSDPARVSSVAKALTNGLCVACVNPGAFSGTTPNGCNVYQACGQDVRYTPQGKILIDGDQANKHNAQSAFDALDAGPGILLAFGLGESASIVGNNKAGLDHAPVCPLVSDPREYNYYLVLVRLRTNESGVRIAEYAGLVDSMGNTVSMARALAK